MIHKKRTDRCLDALYYLLSFAISVVGMLLILKSRGFYPFKEDTLFIMDMQDQYLEFFASLRYIMEGDNSIFYSWSRSLGGNYLGLYAYYLANPLSWITVLFPLERLYAGILILTLLKIGGCGLTFSVFASYLWKKYFVSENSWYRFALIPLAVSYALSSYNIIYSSNLMWLDGVMMLPLVLLGIEKILEGRKGALYLVAFALSCLFNYYTGYMVGLFAALYFVFRAAVSVSRKTWKTYIQAALRFAITTLLAVGTAAPLLLPVILDLSSGKLAESQTFSAEITNFDFPALFVQLKNGAYTGLLPVHGYTNMPNIYCGYIAFALAITFFLSRKVALREKLAAGALFLILVLSFYLVPLNLIWHGLQYPAGFPYRYSFVLSFFVLYLAVRTVCLIPADRIPSIWQHKPIFECIVILFMGVTALDMGVNGRTLFYELQREFGYDDVDKYEEYLLKTRPLLERIRKHDEGFFRVNQGYEYSKNDAMLLGYNGMAHYSSTFNAAVNSFTARLGMGQDWIYNTGYGSTPLTDSLFAVKYILKDTAVEEYYELLEKTDYGTAVYRNKNVLSVVYSAPASDRNLSLDHASPFRNQNDLMNGIANTDNQYFVPIEYYTEGDEKAWTYVFTADTNEPTYLYMHSNGYSYAKVYVNGEEIGEYFTSETRCILYLGSFEPMQEVRVDVVPGEAVDLGDTEIVRLQEGLLCSTLSELQQGNMQIVKHGGGKLEGTIYVPEGNRIMSSIPYDAGWRVKIDGKQVPIQIYADVFMMFEAEEGEHFIEFSYISPGVKEGMAVFAAAVLSGGVYFWLSHCRRKRGRQQSEPQ